MSFLGKEYTLYKQENFDEFLKYVEIPEEYIEAITSFTSKQRLEKDGDTYTYITNNPDGESELVFESGVEVDDVIGNAAIPIKSTYVVEGDTVTQTIKTEHGTAVFKQEYDGDELVVTITADDWDAEAKRYYKA